MRSRRWIAGVVVLMAVVTGVGTPAESASRNECLGGKPNVVGTKGSDKIVVYVDEAGVFATVNGRKFEIDDYRVVVFGDKGNDTIIVNQDPVNDAYVCGGDGNDTISGNDISRIHAGDGYDKVDVVSMCGGGFEIFKAETVRTDETLDEGPCN